MGRGNRGEGGGVHAQGSSSSLGNGRAKYGPGPTVLFWSLSWAEALHGEYGTVDKALVYNVMKILGLPHPTAATFFKCHHISKTPPSPGSWAGDFSDCTLHWFYVVCTLSSLPSYLVGKLPCPTVHTVWSLVWPDTSPSPCLFQR